MNRMIYLSTLFVVTVAVLPGCKKTSTSCESIFDHTVSLAPDEFKSTLKEGKVDAIAKCEKMPEDVRKCAADAETLEALTACGRGAKKAALSATKPVEQVGHVEAAPAPAAPAGGTLAIDQLVAQYHADQTMKGKHVTVKGLYMTTTQDKQHQHDVAIALKASQDALDIITCAAGSDLAAFEAKEGHAAQWQPMTVEGDVTEENFTVGLANCTID